MKLEEYLQKHLNIDEEEASRIASVVFSYRKEYGHHHGSKSQAKIEDGHCNGCGNRCSIDDVQCGVGKKLQQEYYQK